MIGTARKCDTFLHCIDTDCQMKRDQKKKGNEGEERKRNGVRVVGRDDDHVREREDESRIEEPTVREVNRLVKSDTISLRFKCRSTRKRSERGGLKKRMLVMMMMM